MYTWKCRKKVAERIIAKNIGAWQGVVRLPGALRMAMEQRRVSCHASRLVVVLATTHMYEPPILRSIALENQKITLFVGFSPQ